MTHRIKGTFDLKVGGDGKYRVSLAILGPAGLKIETQNGATGDDPGEAFHNALSRLALRHLGEPIEHAKGGEFFRVEPGEEPAEPTVE